MSDGDTIRTLTEESSGIDSIKAPSVWQLTIVHHGDVELLGKRVVIQEKEEVALGRRSNAFGKGALDCKRTSRRHALVRCDGDALTVIDLGSHNGTFVNGERTSLHALEDGDVIGVGRVLLLAHRAPRFFQRPDHADLIGVSASIAGVLQRVSLAAPRDTTVLLQGETGVGKELVARAIHEESGKRGPFVAVNCSGLSDGVLHSEMFGHARGAFSGAAEAREGLVRGAQDGTLFLDEIGDASPSLQASLLRLLERREYRAVGSDRVHRTSARFIAATHVDLSAAALSGGFRADLYNRLDRWRIDIPPLRARPDDITPLALYFAERLSGAPVEIERRLALALLRYRWPANVRELMSVVEQAVIEAKGARALALTDELAARLSRREPIEPTPARPPARTRRVGKRPSPEQLRQQLRAVDGNVKAAAAEIGIGRSTLYRWLQAAGIDPDEERDGA